MAKTDFKTVDEYQDTFGPEVRERLEAVRKVIRSEVPDAEEVISYQIPAYKHQGYLIYYSGYTNHLSLSSPFSKSFLDHFKEELKGYKTSKSAIQFPHKEKLPVAFIRRIIAFRKKENEQIQTKAKKSI